MTLAILALAAALAGPSTAVSPAEAAAILAPGQYVYVAPVPHGPTVIILASSPTAGPFGEFAPLSPNRPLDQTYYGAFGPPVFGGYGLPFFGGGPFVGLPFVSQRFDHHTQHPSAVPAVPQRR